MRSLTALALPLVALPLLALVAAPAAAEPFQTVPYTLVPVLGESWDITVPSRGPVWIEVVVTRGAAATDLSLDGPGLCAGITIAAPAVLPGQDAFATSVDCGGAADMLPGNGELSLSVLAGSLTGYLVLHGMTTDG